MRDCYDLQMPPKIAAIGRNLKRFRARLSQKKLGKLSGVSFRTIQNAEAGQTDIGAGDIVALARALKVSVNELMGHEDKGVSHESALKAAEEAIKVASVLGHELSSALARADREQREWVVDHLTAYFFHERVSLDGEIAHDDEE